MIPLETLRQLVAEGKSDADIGRAYGISYRQVGKIRQKHGIASNNQSSANKYAGIERELRKLVTVKDHEAAWKDRRFEDDPRARRVEGGPLPRRPDPMLAGGSMMIVVNG